VVVIPGVVCRPRSRKRTTLRLSDSSRKPPALGAFEHYAADTEGHRIATNRAVPMLYPELRRKYGSDVTLALGSYWYAVRSIVPGMTRVAWSLKQDQIKKEIPGITSGLFW
jgi:hypothetical protein